MNKLSKTQIEEGLEFKPRFNEQGLIPCIATSAKTGDVLMMAWMNEKAIEMSLKTGEAHYWSRSRGEIWHKGATSGHTQKIVDMRVDCDQDCLWIKVQMTTDLSCHTGRTGCFYRSISKGKDEILKLNPNDHDHDEPHAPL